MNEVADIFNKYSENYRKDNRLPLNILKAISAIENCRTSNLGGHVDECDKCGHISISYNSCRNRHCPKCQSKAREEWLVNRKKELLPIGYFHVVLTVPNELNPIILRNQKEMYNILFKAASETLITLGKDIKHLGAQIGFIAILHTWGQNLMDHPHIHCVVPGGGLSFDEKRWIFPKKKDFLIHVRPMSTLFRNKFMHYTKKANELGKLKFVGKIEHFKDKDEFKKLVDLLYKKDWVVYCKPPFASSEQVLEYIGRYTHRVAISNSRIINIEDGKVTFKWRDYKDNNKNKIMTVTAHEFIRRFLLHILPDGFMKIRSYGILSNRNVKTKLKKCKSILIISPTKNESRKNIKDLLENLIEEELYICKECKKGRMRKRQIILSEKQGPPYKTLSIKE